MKDPEFCFQKGPVVSKIFGQQSFCLRCLPRYLRTGQLRSGARKTKKRVQINKNFNDLATWNEASTILILLKLILMCSILVFRAMGSTSRVELAQTTRSLASSHSQPLGQNPNAVLAMSKTKVSLAKLFIFYLVLFIFVLCALKGLRSRGFLFSSYQFSPLSLTT